MKNWKQQANAENSQLEKIANQFQSSDYARNPDYVSGCGPYALEKWSTGQQIILKKKENWWGANVSINRSNFLAYPDQLIYKVIPDHSSAISLLKSNQLDILSGIPPKSFDDLKTNTLVNSQYNFYSPDIMQYYFLPINNSHYILEDVNVRKALAHLINVDELIENYTFNLAQRINTPFHPLKSYYNNKLDPIAFDLKIAKEYLHSSGWYDTDNNGILDKVIDGKKQDLIINLLLPPNSELGNGLALFLQQNAKKIGVVIEPNVKAFNLLLKEYRQGNYDMTLLSLRQSYTLDDPYRLWHSKSLPPYGGNLIRFQNTQVDSLIDQIRIEQTDEKRNLLYQKFQAIIYKQQPCIFLFSLKESVIVHNRFTITLSAQKPGYFEHLARLKVEK